MRKFISLIAITLASLVLTGKVYAGSVSIRLNAPQTPTNQTNFDIGFTAMDYTGNTITVKCLKQATGDADFVQFGGDLTLTPAGGNNGWCHVDSSVITGNGTYSFKATASNGTDSATSETVSVVYTTDGPGTPTNWSKTKDSCTYKLGFRSADDSGKTVKVNVYRSTNTGFNLDDSTKIGAVNLGSNTDATFNDTPPDCGKDYYYAVRAFDAAGNGSGVLGDSQIVTVNTVVTPTPGATQGAILIGSEASGNILGSESGTGPNGATGGSGASGETLGTESATPTPEVVNLPGKSLFSGKTILGLAGMALIVLGVILYARRKKS